LTEKKNKTAQWRSEKKISNNKALCETPLCYTPNPLKESRKAKPWPAKKGRKIKRRQTKWIA